MFGVPAEVAVLGFEGTPATDGNRICWHNRLDHLHERRLDRARLRGRLYLLGSIRAVALFEGRLRRWVNALARPYGVGQSQSNNHRNRRQNETIAKRLQTDAPQFANVSDSRDAYYQRRKDQRHDNH